MGFAPFMCSIHKVHSVKTCPKLVTPLLKTTRKSSNLSFQNLSFLDAQIIQHLYTKIYSCAHSSDAVTQRYIGIEPRRIEEAIEGHTKLI